jgi:hypothetical protein
VRKLKIVSLAVGFELFEAIMGVRMRGHGRIAMWMRLAIKPIAMRREKTKNSCFFSSARSPSLSPPVGH